MLIKYGQTVLIITSLLLISSCDKEVSTSPPEPEPPQGFIYVDSNPRNYKIYLDGRFTGRFTPDTLPYVEETEHLIELKRQYWLDSSAITFAEPHKTKSVFIDFFENPKIFGTLELKSEPGGAEVVINDSLTRLTTPVIIDSLLPGFYKIEYRKKDHRARSFFATVESNKVTSRSRSLQDTSLWVDFTVNNSELTNNVVNSIAVDSENRVWAGTARGGVNTIKGSKWGFISSKNSALPSDSIRLIETDGADQIWIGTKEGMVRLNKQGEMININLDQFPQSFQTINALAHYKDEITYIGTFGGLIKMERGEKSVIPLAQPADPIAPRVTALEVEDDGTLWAGISGHLAKIRLDMLVFSYRESSGFGGFPNHNISEIIVRPSDRKIWVFISGTRSSTPYISVWNGANWRSDRIGKEGTSLYDATVDKNNYIWVASNEGLIRFIGLSQPQVYRTFNSSLFDDDIRAVAEDQNGTLWLGSSAGLFKYKKNLLP